MTVPFSFASPRILAHDTQREGVRLGLAMATATWIWVAAADAVVQRPFHTFDAMGGIVAFTAIHYLLNVALGISLLGVVHAAERTPSLVLGLVFGALFLEIGMAMLTIILAQSLLGPIAWVGVFGGSLVSTTLAAFVLSRTHPLAAHMHRAEEET